MAVLCLSLATGACRTPGQSDHGDADAGPDHPDAGPRTGCGAYEPRATTAQLLIGPDGLEDTLIDLIETAEHELWVMMYLFTHSRFVDSVIAAHRRGVDVRILIDGAHEANTPAMSTLAGAGVPVRLAPAQFAYAHTKALLVDRDTAVIMSSNLSYLAMSSERNYGIVDRDPEDIADLRAIFASDWDDQGYPDLSCTRLLVSPINARARMLEHINRAEHTLELAVMYLADESVRGALLSRHDAGVSVRVLLADTDWTPENQDTADELAGAGVAVRIMREGRLHAKLVVSDGVPFVGSQNLSYTALNRNREVGVMVTAEPPAQAARVQFESDWSQASAP